MINIKDKFYSKLLEVNDNVSDVYPNDWARMPAIQYTEEENSVYEKTDKEEKAMFDSGLIFGIIKAFRKSRLR